MTPPGEAIAAVPAGNVAFADNEIAGRETFYVIADKIDNADKLVADGHRHRDRFLRPRVPIIDMDVSPADGRLQDPDEHVVAADFRSRNLLEPQPRLGPAFYDRPHHFLHDAK